MEVFSNIFPFLFKISQVIDFFNELNVHSDFYLIIITQYR